MNRSKQKGTAWETAIVDYLRDALPDKLAAGVERRTLAGAQDRGDIAGLTGVTIEAKNCATRTMPAWVREAETERDNAGGWLGVVWSKVRGKASPAHAEVTISGEQFVTLLRVLHRAGVL